jgi:uncharacterized protein (TIGR02594 family)
MLAAAMRQNWLFPSRNDRGITPELIPLQHSGYRGTGSDLARSFASYGQRVSGPQVGAIAVMGRRGGGHVGIITGIDAHGNPIMISGNNGNRVREAPISRGRIYAYVMPTS